MIRKSFEKYSNEDFSLRGGLYSNFDSKVLYSMVREYKPLFIVDFAPRQGKTTSCIINATLKNLKEKDSKIKYYIFEKDMEFLSSIKEYLNEFVTNNRIKSKIDLFFNGNIINNSILNKIEKIDFLFIDANHDYILAKWYIDNLFSKVRSGGLIHIHDIYYDKNNNGWEDVRFKKGIDVHSDYANISSIRNFYPLEIFEKYYEGEISVTKHEGNIIEEYYIKNKNKLVFDSTLTTSRELNQYEDFNCSIYFEIK